MKIEAMWLAAIVIGTLLGSASVAQARRCYCSDDDSLQGYRTGCQDYDISLKRGIFGNWLRRQSMWNLGPAGVYGLSANDKRDENYHR